jgi:hypothetical protein
MSFHQVFDSYTLDGGNVGGAKETDKTLVVLKSTTSQEEVLQVRLIVRASVSDAMSM